MIKRDMEKPTKFAKVIKSGLNMQDLQGLCKDSTDRYTMAVEAVYMGDDPSNTFEEAFESGELYAKACMAEQLNIPLVVMLKCLRDINGNMLRPERIYVHFLKPNHLTHTAEVIKTDEHDEKSFLTWWKTQKAGRQIKNYRSEMGLLIKNSYFDGLLEANGSSWSGNIDGFMIENRGGKSEVSAIIECRFSSDSALKFYNPNKYFRYDAKPWKELLALANTLNVPLYLFTYTRIISERNKVSAAKINNINAGGLVFSSDKPGNKIFTNAADLKAWMLSNGYH